MIDAAIERGDEIPEEILNAPEVRDDLHFYFTAYLELSSERVPGFGARPLPWSKVIEYGHYYGADDVDEFRAIMQAVDALYLEFLEANEKQSQPAGAP